METISILRAILSRKQKISVCWLMVLMLLSVCLETVGISMVIPYLAVITNPDSFMEKEIVQRVISFLGISGIREVLVVLTLLMMVIVLCRYVASYMITVTSGKLTLRLRYETSLKLMEHIMRERYEDYINRDVSGTINLFTFHSGRMIESINAIVKVATTVLTIIMFSVFMVVVSYKSAFFFLVMALLISLLVRKKIRPSVRKLGKRSNAIWTKYIKTTGEIFTCRREIEVFNMNEYFIRSFKEQGAKHLQAENALVPRRNVISPIFFVSGLWALFIVVLFLLLNDVDLTAMLGMFSAFSLIIIRLIPHFATLQSEINGIVSRAPSLQVINDLLQSADKAQQNTPCRAGLSFENEIVLQDISFKYCQAKDYVFEGQSLTIMKGDRLGIIGKTGSGKTSLVNILTGLLRPSEGQILVDGLDALSNHSKLKVGYVLQDTNLLDISVRDNIAFGRTVSDEELNRVLEQSGITEFIDRLPDGVDSIIGTQGVRLSGGQRQRIGIARALIGSPSLIIFDEATSSLDSKTEKDIVGSISLLDKDQTIIMISHRESALSFCNRIVKIEDKKIVNVV